jgi:purine-binding chemotaxis protein CheW
MGKIAVAIIGEEEFGIEITRIVEILKRQRVFQLPNLPEFLSGVINLRGEIIPVIDLRKRFGIRNIGAKERNVVIRYGKEKIGLIVDDIKEIINLEETDISSPPSIFKGLRTEYMTGIGRKNDRIIIILDLERILTAEEQIKIEEIKKQELQREVIDATNF